MGDEIKPEPRTLGIDCGRGINLINISVIAMVGLYITCHARGDATGLTGVGIHASKELLMTRGILRQTHMIVIALVLNLAM